MLCDALTGVGNAGIPDEYFADEPRGAIQQPTWLEKRRLMAPSEYIRYLIERHSSPNGLFGGKLTAAQMVQLTDAMRNEVDSNALRSDLLRDAMPNLRFIWITRRNKTEQAVSFWKALQSGSYNSRQQGRTRKPKFSFSLIDHTVDQFVYYERLWADFFSQGGIVPLTIVYEDLVTGYDEILRSVFEYIGIEGSESIQLPKPSLAPQSDIISQEWAERYERRKRWQRHMRILTGLPHILGSPERRHVYWVRLAQEPKVEVPSIRKVVRGSPGPETREPLATVEE